MGLAALLLVTACNKTRVTKTIVPSKPVIGTGVSETVVLMPLADYSKGVMPDRAARRQAKSLAALSQQMTTLGLMPAVQEDVYGYLFDSGLITPVQSGLKEYEADKWGSYVNSVTDSILESGKDGQTHNIMGFTADSIKAIGEAFSAGYVLRGRILEYNMREDKSWNPMRRGILPFFVDGTTTGLFGIARSSDYDDWQSMANLGLQGAIIGNNVSSSYGGDPAVWGAAFAGTAYLANRGGKLAEARVQLQLALQSTTDGKVIWANRVEIAVAPDSAFDRSDEQHLVDRALEEASEALIADMGRAVFGVEPPASGLITAENSQATRTAPILEEKDPFDTKKVRN